MLLLPIIILGKNISEPQGKLIFSGTKTRQYAPKSNLGSLIHGWAYYEEGLFGNERN